MSLKPAFRALLFTQAEVDMQKYTDRLATLFFLFYSILGKISLNHLTSRMWHLA